MLAPSYPSGGEQGDHLIFRWSRDGVAFAVGLHGWEPLSQTMATLKTMTEFDLMRTDSLVLRAHPASNPRRPH